MWISLQFSFHIVSYCRTLPSNERATYKAVETNGKLGVNKILTMVSTSVESFELRRSSITAIMPCLSVMWKLQPWMVKFPLLNNFKCQSCITRSFWLETTNSSVLARTEYSRRMTSAREITTSVLMETHTFRYSWNHGVKQICLSPTLYYYCRN